MTELSQQIINLIKIIQNDISSLMRKDIMNAREFFYNIRIPYMIKPFENLCSLLEQNGVDVLTELKYISTLSSNELSDYFNECEKKYPIKGFLKINNQIEHFALRIREFCFLYTEQIDHNREFGNWAPRLSMDSFFEKGLLIAHNIIKNLSQQEKIETKNILQSVDDFLRKTIAKQYKFSKDFSYEHVESLRKRIAKNTSKLSNYVALFSKSLINTDTFTQNQAFIINFFQLPTQQSHSINVFQPGNEFYKLPLGFEFEFDTGYKIDGSEIKTYHYVREQLKKLGYTNIHGEKSENCYNPEVSDGVLHFDPGMSLSDESTPLEFSTPIMVNKKMKQKYIKIMNFIEENGGFIDESSGLHIHYSKANLSENALKRLVLREAQIEDILGKEVFYPQFAEDYNYYSTTLLSQLGYGLTKKEKHEKFVLFSCLVSLSSNLEELKLIANLNKKYCNLSFASPYTLERRGGPPGTFSAELLDAWSDFYAGVIIAAHDNLPYHYDSNLLQRVIKLNKEDCTKRRKSKYFCNYGGYNYQFNGFNPEIYLPKIVKDTLILMSKDEARSYISRGYLKEPQTLQVGYHCLMKTKLLSLVYQKEYGK